MSTERSPIHEPGVFKPLQWKAAVCLALLVGGQLACSSSGTSSAGSGGSQSDVGGAASSSGGSSNQGGTTASAQGGTAAGGATAITGGASAGTSGGTSATTGGTKSATGGASAATGGAKTAGGASSTGGTKAAGGASAAGGTANATGGASAATGGANAVGGAASIGGTKAAGGAANIGGTKAVGGAAPTTGGASATNGGATAAGGATSNSFHPCPTTGDACMILPLGDSITYGLQSSDGGGYREPLFKKTLTASQKITFTGSQKNGPATVQGPNGSVPFPTANEGNSGFTIDQIRGTIPAGVKAAIPHIVLLMAGTNDVYASSGQAQMPDRLTTLINAVVTAAPNALIVVATLTPLSNASWEATATTYDGEIPGVIQTIASAGKHVIMVDMSKMPTSELSDGVHPNDTGYSYMADIWYAAIKDLLPSG